MNHWSKIVLSLAVLATAGWVAVGLAGEGAGRSPEGLTLHALLAYSVVLVWVLADIWIVVFLAGCERAARRGAGAGGAVLDDHARARRRVSALGAAAVALALGQFGAAGLLYPGRMPYALHFALAALALVAQLALIVAGARAFGGLEGRLEDAFAPRPDARS